MTDPTPQDHIRTLEDFLPESQPARDITPTEMNPAVRWALPLLRAMYEIPPNPHGLDMIGILEDIADAARLNRVNLRDVQAMVQWASPILRSYVARKRTIPATANAPAANIANLHMMAEGKAVPWDLAQAALDWALPILEASMATEEERKESMAWLARMANRPIGYTAPMTEEWVQQFAKAISLLRAPAPSSSISSETTNSTRFSRQERQEVADWLTVTTSDPKMPESASRMYDRAIAMILAPAHERWTEPEAIRQREELTKGRKAVLEIGRLADFILDKFPNEPGKGNLPNGESAVDVAIRLLSVQSSESMRQHADKIRRISNDVTADGSMLRSELREAAMILQGLGISFEELAKLESFIEEKFPGELNGRAPVTVATLLLGDLEQIDSYMKREHDSIIRSTRKLETKHPIAMAAIHIMVSSPRADKEDARLRLPTLDAPQIPVTRDLALEVLRGFLATIRRAYPYAPSPSPDQWATAREALIFVLADEKHWEKCADSNCDRTTSPFCSDHDADLRRELATDDSIIARSFIDPIRMLEALMNYMAGSALATDKEWASKIEWAIKEFSEGYMKKCRPGTMNMMPVRCDACTAPAGAIHLPIPEAPAEGERVLRDQYLNQRDKAWGELRKIRDMLGLKTCKEIEAKIRVLQRDIVDLASDPPRQDRRIAHIQETIVAMAHQERAIASIASNLESVRLAALGKLGLLDSISMMLDGM